MRSIKVGDLQSEVALGVNSKRLPHEILASFLGFFLQISLCAQIAALAWKS